MNIDTENMNVLHLLSSLKIGGLEKLFVDFTKASGKCITVVIMNDQIDKNLKEELIKTGHKVYFFNRKEGYKHPKYLFQLLKIIKENKINIVHSHNSGGMMWAILCKMLYPKLKLVHTIHNSVFARRWGMKILFFNRFFIDMNIAISEDILNNCVKNNLKAIKIYNGIDTKKWKQAQGGARLFSIINVGRITYQHKGQDILIKALKECKDKGMKFVCNFIGGVYEYDTHSFEYLKKIIEDLKLSEEIKFLGNRNDIPELLSQSDLFILPSRYEGLPISLLEAMAAKLPVIASNVSGSTDLIEHKKNGLLFESENPLDLADKILYLYNNRGEMKLLAQNAYEYVQGFDISIMCEKYWELYKYLKTT